MVDVSTPTNLPDFADLDLSFDIIDSHHHLFDLREVYYPWLTDHHEEHFLLGNYEALKQNYGPADFRADAAPLRVVKTVHVEAETDREAQVAETEWLLTQSASHGLPDAIVAHAWFHEDNSADILAAQASIPAVRGIRSKPITAPNAAHRDAVAGAPGSLQDPAWRDGLGRLRQHGLSWDLRVPFWHLVEAAEVCALYPDLAIVAEHTGLAWDRSAAGLAEWRRGMVALAAMEHVHLKISELGLAGAPWDYDDNRTLVREAIEIFGFDRCMFASNFPVAKLRIGYVDQVSAIAHMIKDCSKAERGALFHDTAKRFYRL
ncbi:MAG: amidohydrolase family protein [Alphaproteobacteria bacterium]|nr:amidohydrolase family protein [Alphaproteobacteria bacterium]